MGFANSISLIIVARIGQRKKVIDYLMNHESVNTLSVVNGAGNVLVMNIVNRQFKDYHEFRDELQSKFKINILHENWIVEELKKEAFMCNQEVQE